MSLASHSDRRPPTDVAHPSDTRSLCRSGARPHRVGNDATQAPPRASSLDSRRRIGSAGDAAFSKDKLRGCGLTRAEARRLNPVPRAGVAPAWTNDTLPLYQQRNDVIRQLHDEGATNSWLSEVFGVNASRISQIVHEGRTRAEVKAIRDRARTQELMRVGDACVALYEAGLVMREIAEATGFGIHLVSESLQAHPDYEPRRYLVHVRKPVAIPAWVPDEHAERYQWIAAGNGEEVAASCIRRLKSMTAVTR